MLFDTHCHLQFKAYDNDRVDVLARCAEKGMITNVVGTQKDTSRLAVELAEKYDWIYATIGTHPIHLFPTHIDEEETSFVSREEIFDEEYYEELVKSKKVIAIGETGIDLFHIPEDKSKEEILAKQSEVFLAHINFAQKHNLPLVIHSRESHEEIIEILNSKIINLKSKINGTMHCYSGNWYYAEKYLQMGLYLGFTGVLTFPARKTNPQPTYDLLEVIRKIPLDRILVETDSPYLAPQLYRGERAEPWMVAEVLKKIAEVRGMQISEVEKQVEANARKLFGV